ncbi:MAG: hypothetical protein ACYDCO_22295 [Armatimonadota bacterium]
MAKYGPGVPEDIGERVQQVIDRLDRLHHQLRDVEKRIEGVEALADRVTLLRVRYAARDAFIKVSKAGIQLVDTHLHLNYVLNPQLEKRRKHE